MRFQEFYESPHEELNGKFFTYETGMDKYAESNKNKMSYFEDWNGFNIPGHIFDQAIQIFRDDYTFKERMLVDVVNGAKGPTLDKYYVIATDMTEDCMAHEQAHALFYLNPDYKKSVLKLQELLIEPAQKQLMADKLVEDGYSLSVLEDEINSYLIDTVIFDKEAKWKSFTENSGNLNLCAANSLHNLFNQYKELQQSL